MSQKNPIVVVTGSSGAGTSTVKHAFEQIFTREKITPVIIEGDSFHRYDRAAMKEVMAKAEAEGDKGDDEPSAPDADALEDRGFEGGGLVHGRDGTGARNPGARVTTC